MGLNGSSTPFPAQEAHADNQSVCQLVVDTMNASLSRPSVAKLRLSSFDDTREFSMTAVLRDYFSQNLGRFLSISTSILMCII